MQNTVYECKQNGEDFFSSLTVTYFRFGNCPANGLVTEQPQYYVVICIFSTWQNTETKLISNDLRFIFTCSLSLAQPITFHIARHTFVILTHSDCRIMDRRRENDDKQYHELYLIKIISRDKKIASWDEKNHLMRRKNLSRETVLFVSWDKNSCLVR